MDKITLNTKEELNIYMNPMRQQLLRQLDLSSSPMTPKMLSDKLNISASGVQHHIKKLMKIGLLELDRTEVKNGITASFYRPAKVTVQIGLGSDDGLMRQREVLTQNMLAKVYNGFREQMKKRIELYGERDPKKLMKWGDILSGIIHLSKQESDELLEMINSFIKQHEKPNPGSCPWEYAIIAYNAGE